MFEKLTCPVTVLFGEEEKKRFQEKCRTANVEGSSLLRSFARHWMTQRPNDMHQRPRSKYVPGVNAMHISAPCKGIKGNFHVRL